VDIGPRRLNLTLWPCGSTRRGRFAQAAAGSRVSGNRCVPGVSIAARRHDGWTCAAEERRLAPIVTCHQLARASMMAVLLLLPDIRVEAQGVVMQRNVSLPLARLIADATIGECKAKGFATAVAVVDRSGQVLVQLRDEQASVQMLEMARRKAYTARMFRTSTMDFQKRTGSDPTLLAQRDVADILALGGGIPIQVGGETIGGVGSSGSSQDGDDACAKAGVAKAAALLK
jgi:uncharacterized protein GlcG (DUF336 family)